MSNTSINKRSESDWERIDAMTDEEIDTSDIPALTGEFFSRARVRWPRTQVTATIQVDADVLDWFKAQGPDYERRINAALRLYAEIHRAASQA
jgi:uncharacterized protein (DUF4415 family)